MKLFKKFHRGQDPGRSNDIPPPSPSPSPSSSAPSPASCAAAAVAAAPSPPSPVDTGRAPSAAEKEDYISSEEEFQVQLALALSASNSEFREDPDGDQIRAAKLLSLGKPGRGDHCREAEGGAAADSLSLRYWEYNVLDYNEKIVDGFYDIFGGSNYSGSQQLPSLADLQTSIGDLGFEVIIVSHAIDPALVELEQVAQCISMDCPRAEIGLLVQRIAELVTEHMGGPVRDAGDMLVRWMEKSLELRTSRQTSLLPVGCINLGLSRHRALLFKVLADTVCIPCRLVKGSHYTGVDDDAVNIIKLDSEREFLVDLMAAPGTLIPADVLSAKDAHLSSYNSRLSKDLIPWDTNNSGDDLSRGERLHGEYKAGNATTIFEDKTFTDRRSRYEKAVLLPHTSSSTSGASSTNTDSSSGLDAQNRFPPNQSDYFSSSSSAVASKQKGVLEVPVESNSVMNENFNIVSNAQDIVDSTNLFAELNPFQVTGAGKVSPQFRATDNKNTEYQRRRENLASGAGRPQYPLVWKNRPACNEIPNAKQYNFVEGLFPKNNLAVNDQSVSSSHPSTSAGKSNVSGSPYSGVGTPANGITITPSLNAGFTSSGDNNSSMGIGMDQHGLLDSGHENGRANRSLTTNQLSGRKHAEDNWTCGLLTQNSMMHEPKEHGKKANGKNDRKSCINDRFMGTDMTMNVSESSAPPLPARPSRFDPMLDDVAECEILWEDLVIGERIGLGSYGEVYHAEWNSTEVAVKKFLDQDFYGDSLDEFRTEVRIMRRLRHPNVVLFLGAVTRQPNLSIVSEFLPRGSLYRILHRHDCQIDEKRRIKMALDVAKGMNCLHTSIPTIVHRDLKSPNLLVDNNWTVKVCDFGLSRLKHSTFLSSKSTAGTPEWMAPEVLRNEPSNEKCDVYSFGVILWELATLRKPWSGMNPMQVVGAVGFQDRRLDIPKEVDPLVARIIWECWQTDPCLRPSFAQLTIALKPLQRLVIPFNQGTHSPPVSQEISVNSTP